MRTLLSFNREHTRKYFELLASKRSTSDLNSYLQMNKHMQFDNWHHSKRSIAWTLLATEHTPLWGQNCGSWCGYIRLQTHKVRQVWFIIMTTWSTSAIGGGGVRSHPCSLLDWFHTCLYFVSVNYQTCINHNDAHFKCSSWILVSMQTIIRCSQSVIVISKERVLFGNALAEVWNHQSFVHIWGKRDGNERGVRRVNFPEPTAGRDQ